MKYIQGKHFSITDPKNVNTVIYEISKNDEAKMGKKMKFNIERLDTIKELRNDGIKRTYFVDLPKKSGNNLLFLSFEEGQVTVNSGVLKNDEIKFISKPLPMKLETIYKESSNDGESFYKEFDCTPNMKRKISIIDPETGNEINPIMYFDSKTNSVKGKCKLQTNKEYLVFEVR